MGIEYGKCHCGCNGDTPLAKSSRCGNIKGEPIKFLRGHGKRINTTEHFWDKVDIKGEYECWGWQGSRTTRGYGVFIINRKHYSAHRLAFILAGGVLTEEKNCVCHHCDFGLCCNPKHLFAGSHTDNMQDMRHKGRGRSKISYGEESANAKLVNKEVVEIRKLCEAKQLLQKEIGNLYGISESNVSAIYTRRSWAHLT